MRELESSLQEFGEFLLKAQLVRPAAAPYFVRWVRRSCRARPRTSPWRVESVSPGVRAKRGERLPVVLSMPETVALLGAMSGTPRLMAALIYGGGLRVSECCELRVKDVDFDQGVGLCPPRQGRQRPVDAARGGWTGGTACSPAQVGGPAPGRPHTRGQGVPKPRAKPSRHHPQAHGAVTRRGAAQQVEVATRRRPSAT